MSLSLAETQTVNELAELLYDYLPANPHPYADQSISFPGVATKLGLSHYWKSGSKLPALTTLLENTLEARRDLFCNFILEIVRTGMKYRNSKGNPVTREEVITLNQLIQRVNFKIPELWSPEFLDTLSRAKENTEAKEETTDPERIRDLKDRFIKIAELEPQVRGFTFERFLQEFFSAYDLEPRRPFKLVGEQIDGSFQVGSHTYLVEAKWQNDKTGQADLLVFQGKVGGKAKWSRGLFISYTGFTSDGLKAFAKAGSTSILGMTGEDIFFILDGAMTLIEVIDKKARRAAETGDFFVSVYEMRR